MLLSDPETVFIYNVTSTQRFSAPDFVTQRKIFRDSKSSKACIIKSEVNGADDFFFTIYSHDEKVAMTYRSYLYVPQLLNEEGQFRFPLFAIGMVIVAFYQYFKRKNSTASTDSNMSWMNDMKGMPPSEIFNEYKKDMARRGGRFGKNF